MAKRSLDTFRVLTPCPLAADFQEPVSHCKVCGRDVLDLSACTREEAAALLSSTQPPCVRVALNDGRPVFREVARAAAVAAVIAGAGEAVVRAAIERPPAVQRIAAAVEAARPQPRFEVTAGVVAPGDRWH
jgi:copper oxidase (laccase) domain-containing protein